MNNIILIGMPGAGKSTLGVLLAKALGYHFVDTDILIQDDQEELLQNIINQHGLERFKEIEEETIIKHRFSHSIVATGGSVVYYEDAMEKLKKEGTILYIKLSYETIEARINNIETRGLVVDPDKTLKDLYDERTSLYEKYAEITVNCETKTVEESVKEIIQQLEA